MVRRTSLLGLGAALTATVTLSTAGAAHADLNPSANDAVGVGSDTVQNIANFLADGDNAGDLGYNAPGPKNRLVSFDATPDANDRAGYLNGSTAALPKALNPTVVLRQGLAPVKRPNGSGAGVKALIADTAHNIDFVRMSRLPTTAEQNNGVAGVGPLRVIKISTDALQLAVATTSNAPATALTAAQIVSIYQCNTTDWSAVGGAAGTIVPQIPQSGSGTGDTFRNDLAALNGGPVTLGACVQTVEENEPASLNSNPNAVAPFSAGRKNLYDAKYFNDPSVNYGATVVPLTSGIKFISTTTYSNNRGLYIVFRNSDTASTKKFQPGGALNLIQDLFYNPTNVGGATPFVKSDAGILDITAGGATPTYVDCGSGATVTTC